jgi:flagellar biosynthetic protein FliS
MAKADSRYIEMRFKTATPQELTIITFDILIASTTNAICGLKAPIIDIQAVHDALRRGQRACALLMGSLNFEVGGDVGRNLFRIYEYWHHELFMANMRKSAETIEQLLPDFKEYRATWTEAHRLFRAENATANAAPAQGAFVAVG